MTWSTGTASRTSHPDKCSGHTNSIPDLHRSPRSGPHTGGRHTRSFCRELECPLEGGTYTDHTGTDLGRSRVDRRFLDTSSCCCPQRESRREGAHTFYLPTPLYSHICHSYTVRDLSRSRRCTCRMWGCSFSHHTHRCLRECRPSLQRGPRHNSYTPHRHMCLCCYRFCRLEMYICVCFPMDSCRTGIHICLHANQQHSNSFHSNTGHGLHTPLRCLHPSTRCHRTHRTVLLSGPCCPRCDISSCRSYKCLCWSRRLLEGFCRALCFSCLRGCSLPGTGRPHRTSLRHTHTSHSRSSLGHCRFSHYGWHRPSHGIRSEAHKTFLDLWLGRCRCHSHMCLSRCTLYHQECGSGGWRLLRTTYTRLPPPGSPIVTQCPPQYRAVLQVTTQAWTAPKPLCACLNPTSDSGKVA